MVEKFVWKALHRLYRRFAGIGRSVVKKIHQSLDGGVVRHAKDRELILRARFVAGMLNWLALANCQRRAKQQVPEASSSDFWCRTSPAPFAAQAPADPSPRLPLRLRGREAKWVEWWFRSG